MSNYYQVLGVGRRASQKEIQSAFRRLAKKYHPDLNPGNDSAERQFKRINEAYEVLSNPRSRQEYDRRRDHRRHSGHSRHRHTEHHEARFEVDLEEAFYGTTRVVTLGNLSTGRQIEVSIPPGVRTGSKVRVHISRTEDLLITVRVQTHRIFKRRGHNLHVEAQIPFEVAALGGEAEVETMTGRILLKIPPLSGSGRKIRLRGRGMPILGTPGLSGHLIVTVRPMVPHDLTDHQRQLLEAYRQARATMSGSAVPG